jgi:amidase
MGSLGKYEEIGSLKRKERDEKIPAEWRVSVPEDTDSLLELPRSLGIFSKRELNITESYDSVGLIEQIRKGEFTSLEVAQAFCKVRLFSITLDEPLDLLEYREPPWLNRRSTV